MTYTVKYKNNSDKDIENGRIEIKYPEHFQFADGSPQPNLGKNIWNVGTLSSQQEGEITFRGSFAGASAGRSEIFDIAFLVLDNSGKFFTQASTSFTTALETLPLFVTVEATSGAPNGIVKPGDSINYKVSYRNNASVPARGAIIVVNLESPAVSYSSIRAEGAQINNGTITWNASSDRNLEVINPNESGSFDFNLDVNNPPVRDTAKNIEVKTTVKIKSDEYETFLPGNELALKVSTLASVTASVEHTSGALPPKVGNSTTYTLTLALRNGTNDLKDGILTAFIPVASSGVDVSSVQPTKERTNVTFDASTGKITWKVGTLTAHTGTFSPLRKMSINVRITPSSGQAGKEVELLKSISYKTTDSFTSQNLTLTAESIGTGDLAGENNFNNGFVSP